MDEMATCTKPLSRQAFPVAFVKAEGYPAEKLRVPVALYPHWRNRRSPVAGADADQVPYPQQRSRRHQENQAGSEERSQQAAKRRSGNGSASSGFPMPDHPTSRYAAG